MPTKESCLNDAERLAAIDAQINRARLLEGTSDVVFLRRLLAESVAQRSATSPQIENPTPRLRALSIANQHASLFTSAGGREQVTEAIEKHIIAALNAAIVRTRDAAPQPGDAERLTFARGLYLGGAKSFTYSEVASVFEALDAAQSALADSKAEVARLKGNPGAKILDHKWLDSECVEKGCQSLRLRSPTATGEDRPMGYTMHDMDIAEALFTRGERTAIGYSDRADIAKALAASRAQGEREGIERAARYIEKMGTGAGPYGACRRECAAILRALALEPQSDSARANE